MKTSYKNLVGKIGNLSPFRPSANVDKKKFEDACDKIANEYVWVLKRRSDPV